MKPVLFSMLSTVLALEDSSEESSLLQVARLRDATEIDAVIDSVYETLVQNPSAAAEKINQMTDTEQKSLLARAAHPDQWILLAKKFDALPLTEKRKIIHNGEASQELQQIFGDLPQPYREKVLDLIAEYDPEKSAQMEVSLLAKGSKGSDEATSGKKKNPAPKPAPPAPTPLPPVTTPPPVNTLGDCPPAVGQGKCEIGGAHKGACYKIGEENVHPQCIEESKLESYICPQDAPEKCKFAQASPTPPPANTLPECPPTVGQGKCQIGGSHKGACYKIGEENVHPQCLEESKLTLMYICPQDAPVKCKFKTNLLQVEAVDSMFETFVKDPSAAAKQIDLMSATAQQALLARAAQPDQWAALAMKFDSLSDDEKTKLIRKGEASKEMQHLFGGLPQVYREKVLELIAEYDPHASRGIEVSLLSKGSNAEGSTGGKKPKPSPKPSPNPAPEPEPTSEPTSEDTLSTCPSAVGVGKCDIGGVHKGACYNAEEGKENDHPQCLEEAKLGVSAYTCPQDTPVKCKF